MSREDEKNVLNPVLYRRLEATFGHVQVVHRGEAQTMRNSIDLKTGKVKQVIDVYGEGYAISCPICTDTRGRCQINHMYGKKVEGRQQNTKLAYCFNAGCPLNSDASGPSEARDKLEVMILGRYFVDLRSAVIRPGKVVDLKKIRSEWPGEVTRLDKLDPNHEAVRYLADDRGFDVSVLAKFYNVHWCYRSTKPVCENRIIIPIYFNKKMVGWQARYLGELDWKTAFLPKYYTAPGTPKNHILYNFGNAVKYETLVVVEGVMDCWRFGPMSVPTLGATLSAHHVELIVKNFEKCVLLYDPEEYEKQTTIKICDTLLQRLGNGNFCSVKLPEGTDPGSLDRDFLRRFVAAQAAEKGVTVSWTRRPDGGKVKESDGKKTLHKTLSRRER